MEVWKDIEGFYGYQISNIGRVKSVERETCNGRIVHERILKTRVNKRGYEYLNLQKDGKRKAVKVHRAVAIAFLENPNCFPEVNHKDEVKTNNVVTNLEWCDRKYNQNYGTGIARGAKKRSENHKMPILQYTISGEFVKEWDSPVQVQREFGKNVFPTNIISCCRGKYKTSYGYVWKYKDESRLTKG